MLEQLGFRTNERLLIINADDFGLSRANVGIHFTLTSTETMDFRPVFWKSPLDSLVTADGYLPKEAQAIEQRADRDQVKLELEAQIQSALSMGIDATHLDSHAGSIMGLYTGRDFLDIAFDLCVKFGLPLALPKRAADHPFFSRQQRELLRKRIETARDRGILLIDDMIALPYHLEEGETYDRFKGAMVKEIQNAKPGITQLVIHPAIIADHLKAVTRHWEKREMEYRLLRDPGLKRLLAYERIRLISWREIRDLQRSRLG